jgi:hypothetical protein
VTAQVVAAAALLSRYARPAAVPESAGAVEPSASVEAAGAAGCSAAPVSPESEQMVAEHTNTGAAGTITATTTTAHQQQRSTVLSGAVHGGLMGLSASGLSPHAAPFVATGEASSCPGSINTAGSANSASASVAAVATTTTTTTDAATIAPSEVGYGFAVPCTTTNLTNAFEQIHYDGSGRSAAARGSLTCAGGNGASIYALPTVDGSSHGGGRDGVLADVLFAHDHMGVCVGSSIIGSDGGGAATSAHHGIAAAVTAAKSGGNVSLLVAQQQQQQQQHHAMVTAAMAAASASQQVQLLHELGGGDPLLLAADAAYAADGLDKPGTAQVRQQQEQRQCNLVHIALQ